MADEQASFAGIIDFTGLPVGEGTVPLAAGPPFGFAGIIDFTGLPVAMGGATVGAAQYGGRRKRSWSARMIAEATDRMRSRSILERRNAERFDLGLVETMLRQAETRFREEQNQMRARAAMAVLLTEL